MSPLDAIRDAGAAAAAALSAALSGDSNPALEFATSENGPWIPITGLAGDETKTGAEELGADVDQEERTFNIPRQFSGNEMIFPPVDGRGRARIPTGSLVRYQGSVYSVQAWKSQGRGASFRLECLLFEATVLGVGK